MNRFEKVMMEYSRRTEDRINKQIYNSSPEHSKEISDLIRKTKANGNEVYLMTDWHLWKINKETGAFFKPKWHNEVLSNIKKIIKPDDLLIFLGDICDGEYEDKKELAALLNSFPFTMILIRGNNDLFPDKWYLENGFKYVVNKFVYDNMLFTHRPQDNKYKINVHGHCHNAKNYLASEITHYNNQMDIAFCGARFKPVTIEEVLRKYPEYQKICTFENKTWKDDPRIKVDIDPDKLLK